MEGGSAATRTPFERVPWKITDVAIATALVFASFFVLLLLANVIVGTLGEEEFISLKPWLFGVFEGLMVFFVWAFTVKKHRVGWRALGLRTPQARWSFALPWVALLGSLLFTGIYAAIVDALNVEALEPPPVPGDSLGEGVTRVLNSVVIVAWGPFAEELFFRGFALPAFAARFGNGWSLVISAAIFAAAHLQLGALVPIFITGLLLGWLYLATRSLWPPIMAHALQNLIALSVTMAQQS
ncbi:MAG: CPBP family intramembrane metalloprotease [Chloroflexi bacterium]|nr:CPBP family intramembrane metalloprotease [Chloroflexota bacterium]